MDILEFTRRKAQQFTNGAVVGDTQITQTSEPTTVKKVPDQSEVDAMALDYAKRMAYQQTSGVVNADNIQLLATDIGKLETGVATQSAPKTSGGYYSRPVAVISNVEKLQDQVSALSSAMEYYAYPVEQAVTAAKKAQEEYVSAGTALEAAYKAYSTTPTWQAAAAYNQAQASYEKAKTAYESAYSAYETAYEQYKAVETGANQVFTAWQKYVKDSQANYDAWKSTIRDTATIQQEIDAVEAKLKAMAQKGKTGSTTGFGLVDDAVDWAFEQVTLGDNFNLNMLFDLAKGEYTIKALNAEKELLQEELEWSKYFYYNTLADSPDFAVNSQYEPQEYIEGRANDYNNAPWEDPLYEHINGNEQASWYLKGDSIDLYGSDGSGYLDPIGALLGLTTASKQEALQMESEEVALFNYLYKTQGSEAAHDYYNYLLSDLNYRQRRADEEYWKTQAAADPFGTSVFSIATSPLKGLSYLGQATDYITGNEMDPNAPYNKFVYTNNAIRNQVAEQIKENWGEVGSFAYQTGMSMADFLMTTAVSGGNGTLSMLIMGTGAAADTTLAAKDRGLSDDQAFWLGTIAGAAEAVTERFSLEALLKPGMSKTAISYILKNALAEASEEGASTLINTMADIIISKDQSEWAKSIQAYKDLNMDEGEAFGCALADQAIALGLDMLGGAISGGAMGGGGAVINQVGAVLTGMQLGKQNMADIQDMILEGLSNDPSTRSNYLAQEMLHKLQNGKTLTSTDLGKLYQANTQVEEKYRGTNSEQAQQIMAEAQQQMSMQQSVQAKTKNGGAVTTLPDTVTSGVTQQMLTAEEVAKTRQQAAAALQAGEISQRDYDDLMARTGRQEQAVAAVEPTAEPEQIQQEQYQNGGAQYEDSYGESAGPADVRSPAGGSLLYGSGQRNVGAGTGEQAGGLAGRAGSAAQRGDRSYQDRVKAAIARQNLARSLGIQKVSSTDIGLTNGTKGKNLQVLPREHWDSELQGLAQKAFAETGKEAVFVVGQIHARGKDGRVKKARGAITDTQIILQADYDRVSLEQILDHEIYHDKVDFVRWGGYDLNDIIRERFSDEELQAVLDVYIDALGGQFGLSEEMTEEEYKAILNKIREELFADAYAGINAFGAGADKFTKTVNDRMVELNLGKKTAQENGVRQTNGPNKNTADDGGERYSFHGYADDGKGIYESNFPKGTPRKAKGERILRYIQDVWSKKPITLRIESNGEVRYIEAEFDPTYSENENLPTDASKLMGGNRHGNAVEKRVTLDLADDYYQIASESRYNYSKAETGKSTDTHQGVKQWHYFVNDIYFAEHGSEELVPYRVSINVKEKADGNYFYSFSAEQTEGTSTQRTLHAAVNDSNKTAANGSSFINSIRDRKGNVKQNAHFSTDDVTYQQEEGERKARISEILASVSINHAAQFEKYTELLGTDPEQAERWAQDLENGPYFKEFEEYRDLIEQDIRYSMDDAEYVPESDAQGTVDNAKEELIEALRQMTPQQMMGDGVRQLIDQYTTKQAPEEQTPMVKVDRGNLRKALTSTLGLTKEQSGRLTEALDKYTEAMKPKRKKSAKAELDVESRPTEAKSLLRKKILNLYSIPAGQRGTLGAYIDGFADRIVKHGALTEEDRKAFFGRMYEAGAMTIPADEYYAEARSFVKGSHIYVSDSVVADLGDDWQDIRRRAFAAGIYLTQSRTDKNGYAVSGIDVWNNDLAAELPGLFDAEDTDSRTILEKIIRVAEAGKDERISLAEYVARIAREEYTSESDVLDSMERQMLWHLKTFAETAQVEIQLKDRNMRRVMKERRENMEKAQRAKEGKDLRELQQRTLKSLQWLNRNRYRAPEELQAVWDEVIGDIDLYAVGAANEMNWSDKYQATWKDLAQMYKDAMETDPNFLPSEELQKIVTRLDAKKIADMDIGALTDLYKAAVGLRTEFYNRNNVINDEMQRLFAEVYTDSKQEIEAAAGGFTGNKADKFFNMDQLTPMNVLQRMAGWDPNSAFYSMARQLEHGERDMRAYSVKAQRMLEDFLTEHTDWVKTADGQGKNAIWYEVEVPELLELHMGDKPIFGDTVKVYMTPAQKVHMYLESKNQDNLRHMTGGRTFVNKELYSKGKRQEALAQGRTVRLAPETVKQLVSDLTPEEMELARVLDLYYNSFATQEINRVSNILYGYDKAMGKHYAPIYTNQNYTKSEFGVFDVTAEGVGNLKGRQHAVNPSYNISAFDAFERHVDQTARFVGMAIPARNWTTLMNWQEKNNSTADVIAHKWGDEGKKYITDLITTLQSGDDFKTDAISSVVARLQNNYISAVFGANPSIVLKQLGSIPMAGAYLGVRNLPTPVQLANIDRNRINQYTQDLAWRTMGYTTPETKQLKENPNWTQTNKFFKFTFGGGAITAMDGWAASTLWPWAENKVRSEHPELAIGTQEQIDRGESPFYKKVAEEFENALSRSQSVSDEIHQGTLRKSKNPFARAFTLFRSDSAQTYNALRQKIGEARFYKRTGANDKVQKTANAAVGAAFMAMTLNAVWAEAVTFLMALWKHKDKKYRDDEGELTIDSVAGEMAANMLGSLAGVLIGGEEAFEVVGNLFTGEEIYDIETPGMKQLNDVITTIKDEGGSMREIIIGAVDVMNNGGDLGEYFSKHSGKILGSIKEFALAAATYLPGFPAENLEAYLVGTLKWVSPELGAAYEDLFNDKNESILSGARGGELRQKVADILRYREISDSSETADALAELYEAGYTGAVPSDTPSSISIDGEKHALNVAQQQFYSQVFADVLSASLDEVVSSERFAAADSEIREVMLKKLYSYASDRAKAEMFDNYEPSNVAEKIAAYEEAGMELADYLAVAAEGYNVDKYLEAVVNGLPEDDTDDLLEDIEELEPLEGKNQVEDVQKWRVCVDAWGNPDFQLAALAAYMTDTQLKKAQAAYNFDVNLSDFVKVYEIRAEYDENGNGSFSNAEYKKAIDSLHLSTQVSAVLWQLVTGSKSAKNNPYSTTIGQKVLDAMAD